MLRQNEVANASANRKSQVKKTVNILGTLIMKMKALSVKTRLCAVSKKNRSPYEAAFYFSRGSFKFLMAEGSYTQEPCG